MSLGKLIYWLCIAAFLWSEFVFPQPVSAIVDNDVVSVNSIMGWIMPVCLTALTLIALLSLLAHVFVRDTINLYFSFVCWFYLGIWAIQYLPLLTVQVKIQLSLHSLFIISHSVAILLLVRRFMGHSQDPETLDVKYWFGLLAMSFIIALYTAVVETLDMAYLAALMAHSVIMIQCVRKLLSQTVALILVVVGLTCSLIPLTMMFTTTIFIMSWPINFEGLILLCGGVLQAVFFCSAILHKLALKKQHYEVSIDQLQQRVNEGTEDLRSINRKQKILISQLEAANQTQAMFLANISHEVRTPLTAIVGFSNTLKADVFDPQQRLHAYDVIYKNSHQLLAVIDDVLYLTTLESKPVEVTYQDFFMFPFFTIISDNFRQLADQKGLQCYIDYCFPIPTISSMDSIKLRQILSYLMSNAIKFTSKGTVGLSVAYADSQLVVTVSDTGIGINNQQCAEIFEAFHQLDNNSDRVYGGTGLGLTICRHLVNALKGEISVSSDGHSASQFRLTLPCAVPDYTEWVTSTDQISIANIANTQAESMTASLHGDILLAEDQQDSRELITLILERMGFNVHAVSNGQGAIDACQLMDFDIILLDIQMPIIDGLDAFRQIRSLGNMTPVMAITANVMPHEIEKYMALGFCDHIPKPIDYSSFAHSLAPYSVDDLASEIRFSEEEMRPLQCAFLQSSGLDIEQLAQAFGDNNVPKMLTISHKIKGSAATFGFTNLSSLAAQLDSQLKDNARESELQMLVAAIVAHYNNLKADWL